MLIMINIWFVALCLVALCIISFTHYWYKWSNPKCINGGKLPPGSMGFPLIGETFQFFVCNKSLDIPPFLKKRHARYGKLFRTSLAGRPVIVSSDPGFNYFLFQQEGKLVELWYMDSFGTLLGLKSDGISASGYIHKYIRKLILNHFGNERLKENLYSKIEAMAVQYLQSWSTQPSVELKESTATMMIDLTSELLFGPESSKSCKGMAKMLTDFLQAFMTFPLNIPGTTFHRCMKKQKKAIQQMKEILRQRLDSPEKRYGDFLDEIIDDAKNEKFLTEEFIINMMFAFLFVSFESISSTLTAAIIFLTSHPLVVKELREEHNAILRSRENVDSPLTWTEYKSMTFTSHVTNETLRLSSVVLGILRKAIKDIHINGYVIPEGWMILVVPSALHMNPDMFEDPLAFNPWRWKNLGSNTAAKNFIAFGGGMRNCAGADFTRATMSVFLHVLVTKFSWKKIKGGSTARTPGLSFGDGFHVKISNEKNAILSANATLL